MTAAAWAALVTGLLAAGAITLWLTRRTRRLLEERLRRAARRALHGFRARLRRSAGSLGTRSRRWMP